MKKLTRQQREEQKQLRLEYKEALKELEEKKQDYIIPALTETY